MGTHAGYAWCKELIAMTYKSDKVYSGVSVHLPQYLAPSVIRYIDSQAGTKSSLV